MGRARLSKTYIQDWIEFRGLSLRAIQDLSGVTPDGKPAISHASVGRIANGVQPYNQVNLDVLAGVLGCRPVDLLLGPPGEASQPKRLEHWKTGGIMALPARADEGIEYQGQAYAAIPVYDIRISAGPGSLSQDGEPESWHLFRLEFLRTLAFDGIHNLAVLRVDGDSMEPTLKGGDLVLVDRSISRAGRDGMYVVRLGQGQDLQVKRVQPEAGDIVTIRGDNPFYDPKPFKAADIQILGRVVWLSRSL